MEYIIGRSLVSLNNVRRETLYLYKKYKETEIKNKDLKYILQGNLQVILKGCETLESVFCSFEKIGQDYPDADFIISQILIISESISILMEKEQQIDSALKIKAGVKTIYNNFISLLLHYLEYYYEEKTTNLLHQKRKENTAKIKKVLLNLAGAVKRLCQ